MRHRTNRRMDVAESRQEFGFERRAQGSAQTQTHHPHQQCPQRRLLSVLIGFSVMVNGGMIPAAQANPAVDRGFAQLERGWVNDAIATFRALLQRSPQLLEARLGLAIAYQRAGQDTNAWQEYQQVLQQDRLNRRALEAVGLLGGYRAEWQARGILALSTLLELNPQNWEARQQRALLLGYQGRFAESLADYTLLLSRNPSPPVLLGAAQVSVYSGDYARGLQLFEQYRGTGESIPNTAIADYARALQETGRPDQAVQLLEQQLQRIPPQDALMVQLRATLAIAYQANQQPAQALSVLEPLQNQASAALPLARAWSAIARQSRNMELYDQAVQLYQQVLARTADPSVGFLTEVADVLSEAPRHRPAALELYQRLLTQVPQSRSLFVKQQVLARQMGQLSAETLRQNLLEKLQNLPDSSVEQRAIALSLIQLDPPDPDLLPIYQRLLEADLKLPFLHFRLAQMHLARSNPAEAGRSLAAYRQALGTVTPAQELAATLLQAEIEQQTGNFERARNIYQQLVEQQPENVDVLSALAGIYFRQRQYDQAATLYQRVLALQPERWETQLALAELKLAQNQPLAALEQFRRVQQAQAEAGLSNQIVTRRIRALQSSLLQQRGFQPSWERY